MSSDELVSAKSALDLCMNQMKNVLNSHQLPANASMETIGRAYHATETFVQVQILAMLVVLIDGNKFFLIIIVKNALQANMIFLS